MKKIVHFYITVVVTTQIKPTQAPMTSTKPNGAHVRKIAFWKKHQSILQSCADLSKMCDMKILVCTIIAFTSKSSDKIVCSAS